MSDISITKPLGAEHRQRLFAIVMKEGEGIVASAIGVSRNTLCRLLSGLPCHGSSRICVETFLAAVDALVEVARVIEARKAAQS